MADWYLLDTNRASYVLKAALERTGARLGNLDLMIAAQAISADAVLVTNDQTLRRIKRLKTEDWTR
jgi:tRNA(fMet)-specific endonuclease VapC